MFGAEVYLPNTPWRTLTDNVGGYTITNVAPGEYTVRVRYIGMVPLERRGVRVVADSVVVVNFAIQDRYSDVQLKGLPLLGHCRSIGSTVGLDSGDQLLAALFCTTIAISTRTEPPPAAVCVAVGGDVTELGSDPSPLVLSALSNIGPPVYPMSECQVLPSDVPYRVRSTSAVASRISIESVRMTAADRATTASAVDHGTMSAAGWECTFERDAFGWYPTECRMAWQS